MFKKPFSVEGRIQRTEFLITYFIAFITRIIIKFALDQFYEIGLVLAFIAIPIVCWLIISQGIKRAHDLGDSGWWLLFPFYGLWLMFVKGEPQANRFEVNPEMASGV